jgi:hypothetical protein
MVKLHIVQGGVENGDKQWLEKAARKTASARSWVVPKSAGIGDEVVIFVRGMGFSPRPASDRYQNLAPIGRIDTGPH